LGCIAQFMFAFSTILGKLSWNILDILGHDVKPCDQNLPSSQYFSCFLTNFACICIVWNVAKIHARCMWFEFHLVAFTNVSTYILILFFHINQHLMVALNVFYRIWAFFFCFSGLHECLLHAYCWVTTSCSSPRHFAWHATNCSHSASCFNVTFQSCVYIMPISLCKCLLSMFRNVGPSCGGQYANILCQSPLTVYCVKWQIKCQMNHIIQLCCIHKIVRAQWWLKRTSFLKALNNSVTDQEIQILSTRSIQCCCFRNN
jgi:hypothetical protein